MNFMVLTSLMHQLLGQSILFYNILTHLTIISWIENICWFAHDLIISERLPVSQRVILTYEIVGFNIGGVISVEDTLSESTNRCL